MSFRSDNQRWGLLAITAHWVTALAVIGMFALGFWMVGLDYYSVWYHDAPAIHKAVGILVLIVLGLRLVWRFVDAKPKPEASLAQWEIKASGLVHVALYLLLIGVLVSGYLISTAAGKPIDVFGLFSVPALISGLPKQEDLAGLIHEYIAYGLIGLAGLHALAALKHHFIDRDATLKRMLGRNPTTPQ